jgi:hypothetical protein
VATNLSRFLTENSSDPQNRTLNRLPRFTEADVLEYRLDAFRHAEVIDMRCMHMLMHECQVNIPCLVKRCCFWMDFLN